MVGVVWCPLLSLPFYLFSPLSSHPLFALSSTTELVHWLIVVTQALTSRLPKKVVYDL